jgi:hypothetical protein
LGGREKTAMAGELGQNGCSSQGRRTVNALRQSRLRYIDFREFQKKYPDIKVSTVLGRGTEIGMRLMSERRAGKHLADIYVGGTNTLYLLLYPFLKPADAISSIRNTSLIFIEGKP